MNNFGLECEQGLEFVTKFAMVNWIPRAVVRICRNEIWFLVVYLLIILLVD